MENTFVMKEHDDTLKIIRKEYQEQITHWLNHDLVNGQKNYNAFIEQNLMNNLTILQMRSLLRRINIYNECPLTIIGLNPSDPYLAVSQNDMYIGIEPDGYIHS